MRPSKAGAVDAACDLLAHALSIASRHAFHGFAVAPVGHAFAAPDVAALADRAGDDLGLGLRAARDGEAPGDRKSLGIDRNDTRHIFLSAVHQAGLAANRHAGRGGLRLDAMLTNRATRCKPGATAEARPQAARGGRRSGTACSSASFSGQLDDAPGRACRRRHAQDRKTTTAIKTLARRSFGHRQDRYRRRLADRAAADRPCATRGRRNPAVTGDSEAAAILLGAVERGVASRQRFGSGAAAQHHACASLEAVGRRRL